MALASGSIAFVGYNADGNDNLAFVVLEPVLAGSVITFTDNAWDGASFSSGEATWTWTAASDLAAGTIVTMDGLAAGQTATSNLGTINFLSAAQGVDDADEAIYAYTGDASAPNFLAAIANDTFENAGGTLSGTGLAAGDTAIELAGKDADADIAQYNGPRSSVSDFAVYRQYINNPQNWITQNTAADDSNDAGAPDAPLNNTPLTTTDLGVGSIAFVGYNYGQNQAKDDLAFAVLDDIPAGTVIHFTTKDWRGESFVDNGQTWTWTATDDIAAGTIVTMEMTSTAPPTSNLGELAVLGPVTSLSLGATEVVYAYIGAPDQPDTFLSAIASNTFTGISWNPQTLDGTGLTDGVNAIALGGNDVGVYDGSRLGSASFEDYVPLINDIANWTLQDGSGDQSQDGIAPDLPFSQAGFSDDPDVQVVNFAADSLAVSEAEGDSGETLITFTVERSGDTTGNVSFTGTIAMDGVTTADDFGGTAPVSFTGTIEAGQASGIVTVRVSGDVLFEQAEDFTLSLQTVSNDSANAVLGEDTIATGTIANDDVAPASIAFVGYNSEGPGSLNFLAASDIEAGTVIHFRNPGPSSNSDDSVWSWTASSDIGAGTIITMDGLNSEAATSSHGTISFVSGAGGEVFRDDLTEMVYAYLGTPEQPTAFLAAITTGRFGHLLEGTGLTEGVNAVALLRDPFPNGVDIAQYHGPRTGESNFEDYLAHIHDSANWIIQGHFSQDTSADGVFPDAPLQTLPFSIDPTAQIVQFAAGSLSVTQNEGDTGAETVFTFTVERNGTDGELAFTVAVPLGTYATAANGADFVGGTLPVVSGTIPDGQNAATITILVKGENFYELDERFQVVLISASNPDASSVVIGNNSIAAATISNDDAEPTRVLAGEHHTATITLTEDIRFVIEEGGSTNAISWRGDAEIVIDNGGETGSIAASGGSGGSFTLNNLATGVIRGIVSAEDAGYTNYTLNNAGRIELSGDRMDLRDPADRGADVVVNNLAGGVIIQTDAGEDIIRPGDENAVVNNHGIIMHAEGIAGGSSDGIQADAVEVNNYAGGLIDASRHAVTGDGAVKVYNEGTMIGRNGSAVNIDNNGSEASRVFVTNHGRMEGRSANLSDSDGDAVDIDGLLTLENYGFIGGMGHNGRHDGEPNVSEGVAIGGGMITNHAGGEIYGYGRAIQVDNSSNSNALGTTTIVNHGLIRGDGNLPTGVTAEEQALFAERIRGGEAINLLGNYGDEIENTGRIIGGVKMGGGNDVLVNSGTMIALGGSAIDMGEGDDSVTLHEGADVTGAILLGAGNDTLDAGEAEGDLDVDGGDGDDVITTGEGDDVVLGGAGNDTIDTGEGDNVADGGEGDDSIKGRSGDDLLIGGAGNDILSGGEGDDVLSGGEGIDTADYSDDESGVTIDLAQGEASGEDAGNDILAGIENATGGLGDDTLIGNAAANVLDGGAGDDRIVAGAGDTVLGGAGNDVIEVSTETGAPASIDGGEDEDTVTLLGTGTGALGATTNVEKLVVEEGTWSVADGAASFSDIVIEDGATLTSGIIVSGDDRITVEAGGALSVTDDAIFWQGYGIDGDIVIDNAGLIESSGRVLNTQVNSSGNFTFNNLEGGVVRGSFDPRQEVRPDSVITFNNAGVIENDGRVFDFKELTKDGAQAVINNLEGGIIRQTGNGGTDLARFDDNTTVNNWGTIASEEGSAGGGDALDFDSGRGGSLHNYAGGLIEGSRHAVTGKQDFTVVNEGTMIGRNGSAVNFDTKEDELVTITNHGIMEGRSAELSDSDGDAIDVDGLVYLLNFGSISGLGAEGYHDGEPNVSEGLAIGGGTILNYGSNAVIYGYGRAIQVDNSSNANALGATFINNEGLIQGDGNGPEGVDPEDAAQFDLRGNEAINLIGDHNDEILNQSTGRIVGGISMGGGNDRLNNSGSITATGGSAIDMGAGDDVVNLYIGTKLSGEVLLGEGNDRLTANAYMNVDIEVDGGDGDDDITTSFGNDRIFGGAGNDWLFASNGDDEIHGGDGNDTIAGEAGNDRLFGGAGDDTFYVGLGNDVIDGGDGFDTLDLSLVSGPVNLDFAAGRISGAGVGFDTFTNIENVVFGAGDNNVSGGNGDDVFDGGAGDDHLDGKAGDDTLSGGEGNDTISGGSGDDTVSGGAGNDQLKSGSGDDAVDGGDGDDVIDAGSGDDIVLAGSGNDTVNAGSGDDWIEGGFGDDQLTGGSGSDTFVFASGFGNDTITDFKTTGSNSDLIEFDADLFADFDAAMASASQIGCDVVFTIDDVTSLTLAETQISSLSADDFRFV